MLAERPVIARRRFRIACPFGRRGVRRWPIIGILQAEARGCRYLGVRASAASVTLRWQVRPKPNNRCRGASSLRCPSRSRRGLPPKSVRDRFREARCLASVLDGWSCRAPGVDASFGRSVWMVPAERALPFCRSVRAVRGCRLPPVCRSVRVVVGCPPASWVPKHRSRPASAVSVLPYLTPPWG